MRSAVLSVDQVARLSSKPGAQFTECVRGCPTMVVVPAGRFVMGSREAEGEEDEHPAHEVTIAQPLAVGKYEVTFEEWDHCVIARACPTASDARWGRENRPVINVSWDDAKKYVAWLSKLTGKTYRLLSEAEWEYVARATTQSSYSFDGDASQLDQYAWYKANSDGKTQPVGKKKANAFGIHDMHGNVWEWVEDLLHESYRRAPTDGGSWITGADGSRRVVRGGSWINDPEHLCSANRGKDFIGGRGSTTGFRVARVLG